MRWQVNRLIPTMLETQTPIVTAAHVIMGLQTVVSRGVDIAREPAVVTIGMIRGGVRDNLGAISWNLTKDQVARLDDRKCHSGWIKTVGGGYKYYKDDKRNFIRLSSWRWHCDGIQYNRGYKGKRRHNCHS